jgi:acetyl-CoA C-acetyltransferase
MSRRTSPDYPILIGVGQITLREKMDATAFTAIDLAKQAVEACVRDTGRADILNHIDRVSMVHSFSETGGVPVDRFCNAIGVYPAVREETTYGGNSPQWLVNRAADDIAQGKINLTLLVGSELYYRTVKPGDASKAHSDMAKRFAHDPNVIGNPEIGYSPHEARYHLDKPAFAYPLFENALRHHLGMTPIEYRELLRSYFKELAGIAEKNPQAWFYGLKSGFPDDVTIPDDRNRMIGFPYTKLMNPIPFVNQAAALIMTNSRIAEKLSIPREKWIYLHGGAEAEEVWHLSGRMNYYSSPAMEAAVDTSLKMAGCRISDVDFFDLYSCYPCAVMIAALSMGLSLNDFSRMSITGGLPYFGGPGNNYTMHAIVHAVERLRENPEQKGLINGNGWYLTKHAVGIYSGLPPKAPWKRSTGNVLGTINPVSKSPVFSKEARGSASVETYTVVYGKEAGDRFPIVIARLDSGERCLATALATTSAIEIFEQTECIGRKGIVEPGNYGLNIFTFT